MNTEIEKLVEVMRETLSKMPRIQDDMPGQYREGQPTNFDVELALMVSLAYFKTTGCLLKVPTITDLYQAITY